MDAKAKWDEVRALDVRGDLKLGPNTFTRFALDPKRLGFYAARYTFAAKALQDCASILDAGCGDGFFTSTFLQDTRASKIVGMDFDTELIAYAQGQLVPALELARPQDKGRLVFQDMDFLEVNLLPDFEGLCSMDCIEHLDPEEGDDFIAHAYFALKSRGLAVFGTPNEYAASLGSPSSITGHVNSYTPQRLRGALRKRFGGVVLFGLNDGTIHTGHESLWHYILGIGWKP